MLYTFGLVIEQALGHITHGHNLRHAVEGDPAVLARWGLPAYEAAGITARLPLVRSNWTLRAGVQVRRMLSQIQRGGRLDALFFHTQVTATLAQDWLRRFPSIVSLDATPRQIDSLGAAYDHRAGPNWLEDWKWRLNRDCFRQARHIVTWSRWARESLIDEYEVPAEKITVIPPGVIISRWAPPEELPFHPTVRILFVGADLERKGGKLLLEAFRRLKNEPAFEHLPLELHLVTRQALPAEPGVFVYNQMQPNSPDLKRLYFSGDIFCLPTLGDCLPMALAEAGAAGLPLVSTRVGAVPEIVCDGETGLLIPPGDPEPLTTALRRLALDPDLRRRLGAQAAQRVRREHDASANAARLLDLLKCTAAEGRRR
jgi:glycosyltransferase involved in cell wall biosynthesis